MRPICLNSVTFTFKNPCVQLDTSGTNVFKNSLNISQNTDAVFSEKCVDVFRDNDLLFQNYNPFINETSESAKVADNTNETLKSDTYVA